MNITQIIEENWKGNGLTIVVKKGHIKRILSVPKNNKWDVMATSSRVDNTGTYRTIIRGWGKAGSLNDFIKESGKKINASLVDYLADFELISVK